MDYKFTLDWKNTHNRQHASFDGIFDRFEDIVQVISENLPTANDHTRRYIITALNKDNIAELEFTFNIAAPKADQLEELACQVAYKLYSHINQPASFKSGRQYLGLTKYGDVSHINRLRDDEVIIKVPFDIKTHANQLKEFDLINDRGRFYDAIPGEPLLAYNQVCDHMSEFIDNYLIPRFEEDFKEYQLKEVDQLEEELNNWTQEW